MSALSSHEQLLLVSGTLDTSGVAGGPGESLANVAAAFAPGVAEEPQDEEQVFSVFPPEPSETRTSARKAVAKKTTAKRTQAPKPASS
ncbi:hypothetical protein ACFZAM_31235 [Streptomyces sp. NPDC008079]|uniref:hypothetical protein n=1 Tax=Streptomyces sp. NPDC008079 TaxID=3364806 RepID=UPI0036EC76F8